MKKTYIFFISIFIFLSAFIYTEKKETISVAIIPFEKKYKKDNKFLRSFFVQIRNKSKVNIIKYEKVFAAAKKNDIDIASLSVSNYTPITDILKPDILIIPQIRNVTNVYFMTNIIFSETNINSDVPFGEDVIIVNDENEKKRQIYAPANIMYENLIFSSTNISDVRFGYMLTNIFTNSGIFLTNIYSIINQAKIIALENVYKIYDFSAIDVKNGETLTNVEATSFSDISKPSDELVSVIMSSLIVMKFNRLVKDSVSDDMINFWLERRYGDKKEKLPYGGEVYFGDNVVFNFQSEKECYVYIFYFDKEQNIRMIFPNDFNDLGNLVLPGKVYQEPSDDDNLKIKIDDYGEKNVFVFAFEKDAEIYDAKYFSQTGYPFVSKKLEFLNHVEESVGKIKRKKTPYVVKKFVFECKKPDEIFETE